MDFLREQGCEEVQGFLLSRPVEAADFEHLLRRMARSERNRVAV
jgi:EAL domain-containing protein (putative c-di-GMP-specific phosphodiesterase class I)